MPTLKELLEKGESFKYGTDYRKVEPEKQSVSDFESNGLRPGRLNLGTDLYGTDTLRITRQSTALVDDMRANTNANQGLLGGVIGSVTKKVNNFATSLGFPVLQIPTRVSDESVLKRAIKGGANAPSISEALEQIKNKQDGSLVGGILGKFLKQSAQGNPKQVGRRAASSALNIAKQGAKDLLFGPGGGGNNKAEETLSLVRTEPFTYGSERLNLYSTKAKKSGDGELGLLSILEKIQNSDPQLIGTNKFIDPNVQSTDYANAGTPGKPSETFPKFPEFSPSTITQNIPAKRDKTNRYLDSSSPVNQYRIEDSLGATGKFRTKGDTLNLLGLYEDENETTRDLFDFIPLKFYSIGKQQGVAFKATISGLSENFSPSWEGSNFLGNPYTFYTYQTIDRDLTFSFTIYSLTSDEHKANWEKIDFLSSLVYPQNTTNDVYVTPPLLKVTLGNMYKNKLGFIETLSYTVEDNVPWEIGLKPILDENGRISDYDDIDLKNYKLPSIINVSVSYQIVETSNDVVGKKLYPYGQGMIYGQ